MHRNPLVYEVNARVLLQRLARRHRRVLRLSTIPMQTWRSLVDAGFEMVWLMGVWERSPASRHIALGDDGLRSLFQHALADWRPEDVQGSPYAIRDYALDPALGQPEELAELRSKLNDIGLGLVVDFVAGHLARDHIWTRSHPDHFVQASEVFADQHPDRFFWKGNRRLAHGRDPHFGPWTDTAQTNLFRIETRRALTSELLRIADVADGVRCDMAMLAFNDVFEGLWGDCVDTRSRPPGEFWSEAIEATKSRHPQFVFLAEAYWDLESSLLSLGFDFAYDKTLYDRLQGGDVESIRRYLTSALASSGHGVHFIENHDEERAVTALGVHRSLAAATVALTAPGLRLIHDGQIEGCRRRLPVQLVRAPEEEPDVEVTGFYDRLLAVVRREPCRDGRWALLDVEPASGSDGSEQNLIASMWQRADERLVIVVNYSGGRSEGFVCIDLSAHRLHDDLSGVPFPAATGRGLRVALDPWEVCMLTAAPP